MKGSGTAGLIEANETVLAVGAEGGRLILDGARVGTGWRFTLHVADQTPALLDEESIARHTRSVGSWEAALGLLARYPWHRFCPIEIHPEFRERIWQEVQRRHRGASARAASEMQSWRALCRELEDG